MHPTMLIAGLLPTENAGSVTWQCSRARLRDEGGAGALDAGVHVAQAHALQRLDAVRDALRSAHSMAANSGFSCNDI